MQITANLIGKRVSYRVSDFHGVRADVEAAIEAAGLSKTLLPKTTVKKAVGRAAADVAKARTDGELVNGRFVENLPPRKITEAQDRAVWGIVAETKTGDDRAEYAQETTIRMDKQTKAVSAEGAGASEFFAAFKNYADGVTDHDIRQLCRNVIDAAKGISYNPHGHDYFVPLAEAGDLDRLDAFLRGLGIGRCYITPAIDDAASLEATWDNAFEQISSDLDALMGNVDAFQKRAKCLRDKSAKLESLREMTRIYGTITQRAVQAEDVLGKITEAMDKVADKIAEIEAGKAA